MCRTVRFSLRLGGTQNTGNTLNSFDEGVELSFRNLNSSSREWIPLMFFTSIARDNRDQRINIGDTSADRVQIRGYSVLYNSTIANDASRSLDVNQSICGSEIVQNGIFNHIQFRWLQTVTQTADPNRDRILLDDIEICSYSIKKYQIFMDDFNNRTTLE
jgi:hypothetical protein